MVARATPEQWERIVTYTSRDCEIYDTLHPAIRRVIREAPVTVYLQSLMQSNPQLLQQAQQHPYEFARQLSDFLKEQSRRTHRILQPELAKAMAQ
jgi:hypothetical protein